MTYDDLRERLLKATDVPAEDFDPDGNLIDFGLDSLKVFDFIVLCEEQGIKVDFASLAEEPTLNGWWRVIGPQVGGPR